MSAPLLIVREDFLRRSETDALDIEQDLSALLPDLESRPSAVAIYAGLELFLPTAVVVILPAAYLSGLAQEMAREHYKALKAPRPTSNSKALAGLHEYCPEV